MVTMVATSSGGRPIRAAMSAATAMPTSVWSPGNPLPMSWSRVPSRSRSTRWTRWAMVAALAVASRRCRSTVNRWYGLRWGLLRTARPLGQVALEQAPLVERLEGGDGGRARWPAPGPGCPAARRARAPAAPAPAGRGRLRASREIGQVALGGHRGQPQRQRRVTGDVGVVEQDHLVDRDADAGLARQAGDRRVPRPDPGAGGPGSPGRGTRRSAGARRRRPPRPRCARPWPRPASGRRRRPGPCALATCSCSWRSSLFSSRPARRCSSTRVAVSTARADSMATVST